MPRPNLNDTIVAISTGWQPSPVGIVRLSGPDTFDLLRCVDVHAAPSSSPVHQPVRLSGLGAVSIPASLFSFAAPRSYTGQNVAEIHTVGSLPVLRQLCSRLIAAGARRALPGEFTSRAFLNRRLDAQQVGAVLELIEATNDATLRQAARQSTTGNTRELATAIANLTELLAAIEAGIDFVEEEDIRFIEPRDAMARTDTILAQLGRIRGAPRPDSRARPHIALAGLPNAGKSTLFNALIGYERAIVSPVVGTTRDVLSAEIVLDGIATVIQDCAGLGTTSDELELATHVASERAASMADVVIWVHPAGSPWDASEIAACESVAGSRRLLALSKLDVSPTRADEAPPCEFVEVVPTSAMDDASIQTLREALAGRIAASPIDRGLSIDVGPVIDRLKAARQLIKQDMEAQSLSSPELVAIELREAWGHLAEIEREPLDERILELVFSQFCVGK